MSNATNISTIDATLRLVRSNRRCPISAGATTSGIVVSKVERAPAKGDRFGSKAGIEDLDLQRDDQPERPGWVGASLPTS